MSDTEKTGTDSKWVLYVVGIVFVALVFFLTESISSCSSSASRKQQQQQFVGTWYYSDKTTQAYQLDVYSDNTFRLQGHTQTPIFGITTKDFSFSGTWEAYKDTLTLTRSDVAETFQFLMSSDQSTLKEKSDSEEIVLYRQSTTGSSTGSSAN